MTDIHSDKILILDFGAQYTQLIARRIREIGVYCEIWAWDHDPAEIAAFAPKGIILSGGPESTTEAGSPRAPQRGVRRRRADARHLLRHADHGRCSSAAASKRRPSPRVRLCRGRSHRRLRAARWPEGPRRPAAAPGCLDEPRRPRHRGARRASPSPPAPTACRSSRWPTRRAAGTACSSIRKSPTPSPAKRCCAASWSTSAAAARCGPPPTSSTTRSPACARRSAMTKCCSACPAASIPRWSRPCCIGPSATS